MVKDFVDEIVEARSRQNPEFPQLLEAALRSRQLVRDLADLRRGLGLSQTAVAAKMGTSQAALARLEAGESDPRISTVERYAAALGRGLALETRGEILDRLRKRYADAGAKGLSRELVADRRQEASQEAKR